MCVFALITKLLKEENPNGRDNVIIIHHVVFGDFYDW